MRPSFLEESQFDTGFSMDRFPVQIPAQKTRDSPRYKPTRSVDYCYALAIRSLSCRTDTQRSRCPSMYAPPEASSLAALARSLTLII
jgi:hypothetical protein